MKVYSGSEIRNVAVVGHNDTGKTTLVTQLLFNAGAITRLGRIDDGTTVTDFDQDEIDRKHSISTAVAFAEWQNTKINFIDTPGFGIFVMEARTALRVADSAAIVVSGVTGVEVSTGACGSSPRSSSSRASSSSTKWIASAPRSRARSTRCRRNSARTSSPSSFRSARKKISPASSISFR